MVDPAKDKHAEAHNLPMTPVGEAWPTVVQLSYMYLNRPEM